MKGNVLYLPNYLIILKLLEGGSKTSTEIQQLTLISYAHILLIKKHLIKNGWVEVATDDRSKQMYLTSKGLNIITCLNNMLSAMGVDNKDVIKLKQRDGNTKNKRYSAKKDETEKVKEEVNDITEIDELIEEPEVVDDYSIEDLEVLEDVNSN